VRGIRHACAGPEEIVVIVVTAPIHPVIEGTFMRHLTVLSLAILSPRYDGAIQFAMVFMYAMAIMFF
jgi:hypothetical protein